MATIRNRLKENRCERAENWWQVRKKKGRNKKKEYVIPKTQLIERYKEVLPQMKNSEIQNEIERIYGKVEMDIINIINGTT